jgi:hypothetical protein
MVAGNAEDQRAMAVEQQAIGRLPPGHGQHGKIPIAEPGQISQEPPPACLSLPSFGRTGQGLHDRRVEAARLIGAQHAAHGKDMLKRGFLQLPMAWCDLSTAVATRGP